MLIDQSKGMCGTSYADISDSDDECISMKNYLRDMLLSMGYDKDAVKKSCYKPDREHL